MHHKQSYPQNETFFDAKIQTMNLADKFRVMVNNNTKCTMFLRKLEFISHILTANVTVI